MHADLLNDKSLTDFMAAAQVDDPLGAGRVFSVGPYGNRLGFAFQQARAFALANGFALNFKLDTQNREPGSVEIAVLGGGIAGITIMAALHSLGFTRLKLFERKSDVLMDQAYASHRLIHPSYNAWPLAGEYASTTWFPFLNWFAGPCDTVIGAIRHEWETEWLDRFAEDALQLGCLVKGIGYDLGTDRLNITYKPHASAERVDGFEFVFAAFGFGVEKSTLLSDRTAGRYWNMDNRTAGNITDRCNHDTDSGRIILGLANLTRQAAPVRSAYFLRGTTK